MSVEQITLARRKPGSPGHDHWSEWRLCDEAAAESLRAFPDDYEVRTFIDPERIAEELEVRVKDLQAVARTQRAAKNEVGATANLSRAEEARYIAVLLRSRAGGESDG